MGILQFRPQKREIGEALRAMTTYPKNAAMQGVSCKKLLDMLHTYEAPHIVIRLMGPSTVVAVCKCIKMHHRTGIVMRSAVPLLRELLKDERNLKKARQQNIGQKILEIRDEYSFEAPLVEAAGAVEAELEGVFVPRETVERALKEGNAHLLMLVVKWHPAQEDVLDLAATALTDIIVSHPNQVDELYKENVVAHLVAAMNQFPNSNRIQSGAATVFKTLALNGGYSREVGRNGGIGALIRALRNMRLWRETHQQCLWCLGDLSKCETNRIHMRRERIQLALSELATRKVVHYVIREMEQAERDEAERIQREKEEDRKTREAWGDPHDGPENQFVRFEFAEEADRRDAEEEEERKRQEEEQVRLQKIIARGMMSDTAVAAEKTRTQALKRIAGGEKKDGKYAKLALEMELMGENQGHALFVPSLLRKIRWEDYPLEGVEHTEGLKSISAEVYEQDYKEQVDELVGEEAIQKREMARRIEAARKYAPKPKEAVLYERSGAYV